MWHRSLFSSLALVGLLGGCLPASRFVRDDIIVTPDPTAFSICHGHTCAHVTQLALTPAQWVQVRLLFQPAANDAHQERIRIRDAIAVLETIIAIHLGTDTDRAGNWQGFGRSGQMDCIDEATNTTTYLRMLARDGLLRRHRVVERATRGGLLFGWPHTTAVIEETATGQRFAVDSWFLGNGHPPFILPLTDWQAGWRPDSTP